MSNYTDEKNPYSVWIEAGWNENELHDAWKEGHLAAERELAFTEEEKSVARFLFDQFLDDHSDELLQETILSIKKKVLGE